MRLAALIVAIFGGCQAAPSPTGPPASLIGQGPPPAITVAARGAAVRGESVVVDIALPVARGGVVVFVPVVDGGVGPGICPSVLRGGCLDVVAANDLDLLRATTGPDGTAQVTVPVAPDHPTDNLALQALVVTSATVYRSAPLLLAVSDPTPLCPSGYEGPDCHNIDECAVGSHDCVSPRDTCVDTTGAWFCVDADQALVYPDTDLAQPSQQLRIAVVLVNGRAPFPLDRADYVASAAEPFRWAFYDAEDVGTGVFTSPDGVAAFLEEASGGRLSVSGTVVRWQDDYAVDMSASELSSRRDEYFVNAWAAVDPRQYDLFLLVGLADTGFDQRGILIEQNTVPDEAGGRIQGKGTVYLVNSAFFVEAGQTRFDGWVLPSAPWPHEMLHSLGIIGHSQSLWCYPDAASYDPLATPVDDHAAASVALSASCRQVAYGDPFSIMGERLWATLPSAASKIELGWLTDGDVSAVDATVEVDTTVWLSPSGASGAGKTRAVQVDVPELQLAMLDTGFVLSFDRLTLEFRRPSGFDRVLSALGEGPRAFNLTSFWYLDTTYQWVNGFGGVYDLVDPIGDEGVLVYLDHSDETSDSVYLLDTHPAANGVRAEVPSPKGSLGNAGKFASAALRVGETLTLAELQLSIEVLGAGFDVDGEPRVEVRLRSTP
jgi:hypothetical protein